jgi:hypothetical protein
MGMLGLIGLGLVLLGAFRWGVLPQLRKLPWWDDLVIRLWALVGNSRTILVALCAELLGLLDEARLLDWSSLIGSEKAGRVIVVMGAVMIVLRLLTRAAVSFRVQA